MVQYKKIKPGDIQPPNILTKDHYIPRMFGGTTSQDNLVAACGQCNWIRGTMEAEAFYNVLQHWFCSDSTLHGRWHTISREEFLHFHSECRRIEKIQWQQQVRRCVAAAALFAQCPHPHYAGRA